MNLQPEFEEEPEFTRYQRRSRRLRAVRARTVSMKRLSKAALYAERALYPEETRHLRPKTRAECVNSVRPCPFVSCKHHLYLEVHEDTGSVKVNFPDLEVWEMVDSCALDVADRGGVTLEAAAAILNITRERVRQVELVGLRWIDRFASNYHLQEFVGERTGGAVKKRRSLPVVGSGRSQ